ncbi:type IV secretory system conjugative DNA transfer family protein [Pseudarthrobacter sp. PS3-L1]|uniref:type IV secretory system conjugative DNA transfer family protein n=1 Tax=Pseudarthrobacter sp. PS3-L1 TaxID=3046207 RepID=UPI0024B9090A|nr:type IV secretory system conjugative DNA transfer family protein [Pseudarthrobacter sp. PS3-L1]MDJ0322092.1 TraM recognition domain-containing protein [Pseudarthrobacter sp. PS3-L1]
MNQRKTNALTGGQIAGFCGLGLVLVVMAIADLGIYGGSWISNDGQDLPANPMSAPFMLFTGTLTWSLSSTIVAGGAAAVVLVVAVLILRAVLTSRKGRTRIDYKARLMGTGKDVQALTEKTVSASAKKLGVVDSVGIFLGLMVVGARRVYADFESVVLQIWGPRQGKSSTQVIPYLLDAPGAALTTSNKPDVIDATRLARSAKGTIWAFDPQKISGDAPLWFWDPLSYVRDDEKARNLAEIFIVAGRGANAKGDAYFEAEGKDMLTALFLAAKLGNKPITATSEWINQGKPSEPARLLREKNNGIYAAYASALEGQLRLEPAQRDGVVGTAKAALQPLKFVGTLPWITRTSTFDSRPQFSPQDFVRGSKDTLYLLSMEGGGSAAALTTALTVAVAEAAEEYAMTLPRRRLTVPLVMALDEIANVCPWNDLPNKYSHYGSKGIIPIAFLQSYSQGEELWGEKGMRKIFSASSVKVIGSGIDEEDFLNKMSSLIGDYTYTTVSDSTSKTGRSRSVSVDGGKERILSVSDLSSLPIGRSIVKRSGTPPVMIKTVPWYKDKHADSIWLSLNIFDRTPESEAAVERILAQKKAGEHPLVPAYRAALKKRETTPVATVAAPSVSRWMQAANDD